MREGRLPGYAVLVDPVRGTTERDTFTCAHCNFVVHVKPLVDPATRGGLCHVCGELICKNCVGKGCSPMEDRLNKYEALKTQEEIEAIGNQILAGGNPWKI